jgi:hypothetical protein
MTGKCDTTVDFTGDFASFDEAPVQARFELLIQFDQLLCPHFAICAGDQGFDGVTKCLGSVRSGGRLTRLRC